MLWLAGHTSLAFSHRYMKAARADSAAASQRGAMQMLLDRAEQLKGIAPPQQPPQPQQQQQPQQPPPALPSAPAGGVRIRQSRADADASQQAIL